MELIQVPLLVAITLEWDIVKMGKMIAHLSLNLFIQQKNCVNAIVAFSVHLHLNQTTLLSPKLKLKLYLMLKHIMLQALQP